MGLPGCRLPNTMDGYHEYHCIPIPSEEQQQQQQQQEVGTSAYSLILT